MAGRNRDLHGPPPTLVNCGAIVKSKFTQKLWRAQSLASPQTMAGIPGDQTTRSMKGYFTYSAGPQEPEAVMIS
jgi:hypothetical protein